MSAASSKNIIKDIIKAFYRALLAVTNKILPAIYYVTIIVIISGIAAATFSVSYLKSQGKLTTNKTIIISPGSSTISIAKQLAKNNIIEFPRLFTILIQISDSGKTLKAGEYSFAPAISPIEVFKKIETGDVVIRKMTIPEGLSTFQILELLEKDPAQRGALPNNISEGELLPETYEYHYNDKRIDMVKRMQEAMRKTIDDLWEKRQEGLPLKNKQEALILASIIEKETALANERKRVAAVFINRLNKNMRLQTDPSVIYAITNGKYTLERPLSHKDLEIDSEYNTYRNSGLPPSPIATPGRASIEAALNPLNTDEIFFVANGSGGHIFSSTLKAHNKNVDNLRKIEKEMRSKKVD